MLFFKYVQGFKQGIAEGHIVVSEPQRTVDEFATKEKIHGYQHTIHQKLIELKVEAPLLLRKEMDEKIGHLNSKLLRLNELLDLVLRQEALPTNWEAEFEEREEEPVSNYKDRLEEGAETR